jgi:hypothetical protein
MSDLPDFQRRQLEFAAYIRDPAQQPCPPDVEPRRMEVYSELFFNNIEDFLSSTFPVLARILGDERWFATMRDFYARHRATTPLFPALPGEFVRYLDETRTPQDYDPPFLVELAHYEWMELVAAQSDATLDPGEINADGDLLEETPVVSPLAWVLGYDYPVHRIGPDYQPEAPGETPTWLLVYRDGVDEVRFVEINAVTARLLQLLDGNEGLSGNEALERLASELNHPEPEAVQKHGHTILTDLHEQGIVPGTRIRR